MPNGDGSPIMYILVLIIYPVLGRSLDTVIANECFRGRDDRLVYAHVIMSVGSFLWHCILLKEALEPAGH